MSAHEKILIALVIALFAVLVLRDAWINDDAYITLRTVDNFVHGYGLRWNVADRVQVFTHPLWMFLLSGFYVVTREAYFTVLAVSLVAAVGAFFCVVVLIAGCRPAALLAAGSLLLSVAFIQYSTSGLENPLLHLLLGLFLWRYLKRSFSPRDIFLLALLAALGMCTRLDAGLLFLPPLALAAMRPPARRSWIALIAGLAPLVIWHGFSLFYYGFLLPNTAYAKLPGEIGAADYLCHGLSYLRDAFVSDPVVPLAILAAILLPFLRRARRLIPISAGIVLYLLYILKIGGCFMRGRFLTAPLLCAAAVLAALPRLSYPAALALLLLGASVKYGMVLVCPSSAIPALDDDTRVIFDEHLIYYPQTGLVPRLQGGQIEHHWATRGRRDREKGPGVVVAQNVGFYGFYAGPKIHVIDSFALGDPLLSHLPIRYEKVWNPGHFHRDLPAGYVETIRAGVNRIEDPDLARFWDRISLITRGGLMDRSRWRAILAVNLGRYRPWREAYRRRLDAAGAGKGAPRP